MINIGAIKNISRVKKCTRGSIITGEGLANIMFIILKGEVGVYTNYRLPSAEMIRTLGAGDLFADPGLLQDKRAAYATAALSDVIVLPIDRKTLQEFLQDEPALAFEMIKDLYLRLEQTSTSYEENIVHHDEKHHHEKTPDGGKTDVPADPVRESPDISLNKSKFKLFPDTHGRYELMLSNNDTEHIMRKSHTCPVCKSDFSTLAVKASKLILTSTDTDLRNRYKDIEPLYYEVLTCPHCLYSALPEQFEIPDKSKADIARELEAIKNSVTFKEGTDRDADSVFTSFYLALFCAPISFSKHQLVTGKLLHKLSRVYQDAGDAYMEKQTTQKALENYLYAYEKIGISPIQEQQICVLIGELYFKQGDLKNAISFFFKAKASSSSTPILKKHAENRVYDIRDMAAACR